MYDEHTIVKLLRKSKAERENHKEKEVPSYENNNANASLWTIHNTIILWNQAKDSSFY